MVRWGQEHIVVIDFKTICYWHRCRFPDRGWEV